MIITKRTGKWRNRLNFIDSNDNFVGWDDESSCCEDHQWIVARDPQSLDDLGIDALAEHVFDTSRTPMLLEEHEFIREGGGIMCFPTCSPSGEQLYLLVMNDHNGYYSHGWEYHIGDKQDKGYL